MQNMDRRRQNAGREFLSLQSPHRASTISSHSIGSTEAETRQLDVKDKDPEGTLCQVQVPMLPSLWAFLVPLCWPTHEFNHWIFFFFFESVYLIFGMHFRLYHLRQSAHTDHFLKCHGLPRCCEVGVSQIRKHGSKVRLGASRRRAWTRWMS